MHVEFGESFQTHIYLQNLVSIQPRTSPVKFAASPRRADAREVRRAEAGQPARLPAGDGQRLVQLPPPPRLRQRLPAREPFYVFSNSELVIERIF